MFHTITPNSPEEPQRYNFIERVSISVGIAIFFILLILLLGFSFDILLLIMASLLIALPLRQGARALSKKTNWKEGICLAVVCLSFLVVTVGVIWLMTALIGEQISELQEGIPETIANFQKQLSQSELGQQVLRLIPSSEDLKKGQSKLMNQAGGVLSSTFGVIGDFYVIFFLSVFIAAQPQLYRSGIIHMIPKSGRDRANEVLDKVTETLVKWLMGQLLSMSVVGILTFLGLWALGIPLAGALALLAAIFAFIPNIGPIISLVPTLLFALLEGPNQALYVGILYVVVQAIESNVVTPIVQKRMIDIPPALVLVSQLIVGVFSGVLGLMLATPLMAMILVLVKMLYVQDTLKDDSIEV